ncbi:Isochorismatase hydrolase [Backusella circina FSU 941]|nr:Isochorismatase hydrolase [Backusella circina FSU 941]
MTKIALILVDIQYDFLEGGSLAVVNASSILPCVKTLINYVKQANGIVVASQDWHPQNHISFASNHKNKQVFENTQIEYEGAQLQQTLWPNHCVQESHGAELSIYLPSDQIDYIVKKGTNPLVDSYSAFADNNYGEITSLAKILYQNFVDKVLVVGLAADYCVKFTCLDAVKFGFETVLVEEGTKPVDPNNFESTLELLRSKGVEIASEREFMP